MLVAIATVSAGACFRPGRVIAAAVRRTLAINGKEALAPAGVVGGGGDCPPEGSETYTVSYLAALVVLARLSAALGQSSFDERHLSELPDRVCAAAEAPALLESPPERLLVLAGVGPGAVTAR